jgi:16S rRNA processing protein RimM
VGRPHGLDGGFHVITRDPDLLGEVVTLAGAARRVLRRSGTDRRPLLRVEGVDSREAAEALRGEALWVERPPLGEDEYWAEDLVGCEVAGRGRVARMVEFPSCEALELEDGSLIPLVRDAIARVDLERRRIDLHEEFLDAD